MPSTSGDWALFAGFAAFFAVVVSHG